jgi:hypothetical protein
MSRRILLYGLTVLMTMAVTSIFQPLSFLQALAQPQPSCHTFTETGKTVCGKFLDYWQSHGGLAQQGFPLSNQFIEVSDLNNQPYMVQYFERAVFEAHPENLPPYDVLLSQLGTFQFQRKYPGGDPSGTTPTPVKPPNAPTPTPGPPTPTVVETGPPPRIPLAEFKALYDDPARRPYIIDVRAIESYQAGHIKGAISFPEADVDARVGELPRDKLIVAYCQ